MSGERKLLIISASILCFFFLLKLVETLPSMFSSLQQTILIYSGVGIILIIISREIFW